MIFVKETIDKLVREFDLIPSERKEILKTLAAFVEERVRGGKSSELIFICTHNSRRSHMGQIWAQTAAAFYDIPGVTAYSGGTEATAFNPRAVDALRKIGFRIDAVSNEANTRYSVSYSDQHPSFTVFSKKYEDAANPSKGFAAVMTCNHADENCPVVFGASARISLPFNDPKDFDGTPQEAEKYTERSFEIGREILYAFSLIKK